MTWHLCVNDMVLSIYAARYPYTYQMRSGKTEPHRLDCLQSDFEVDSSKISQVTSVPFPVDGVLQPGQTVSLPVWLRGNDIGGVHEVDLLFYYEPVGARWKVK